MSRHPPLDTSGLGLPSAWPKRQSHWGMHSPANTVSYEFTRTTTEHSWEPPILAQARDIIATILSDSDPSLVDIQRCLREKVADHPGFPHKALLAHLLETRQRANS